MSQSRKTEEVPFTMELLNLFHIMNSSRKVFVSESCIAESLGLPAPKGWDTRCRELFFDRYADICNRLGLSLNEVTYRAISWDFSENAELVKELNNTSADDLPKRFSFSPWCGIQRISALDNAGGI